MCIYTYVRTCMYIYIYPSRLVHPHGVLFLSEVALSMGGFTCMCHCACGCGWHFDPSVCRLQSNTGSEIHAGNGIQRLFVSNGSTGVSGASRCTTKKKNGSGRGFPEGDSGRTTAKKHWEFGEMWWSRTMHCKS